MTEAIRTQKRRKLWLPLWAWVVLVFLTYFAIVWARMLLFVPQLEIGPETTVLTEPLAPDGTIDYAAALNEMMSQGVSPENNAALPLLKAFGPEVFEDVVVRSKVYDAIGLELPSDENTSYVVSLFDYLTESTTLNEEERELVSATEYDQALSRPWSAEEFPEIDQWLKINEPHLDIFIEASIKENLYIPIMVNADSVLAAQGPSYVFQQIREAARMLSLSALHHVQAGEMDAAINKSLAIMRLSQLVGERPFFIDSLVAFALRTTSIEVIHQILLSEKLTAEQLNWFENEFDSLPTLPPIWKSIDVGERYGALDMICKISNGRVPMMLPGAVMNSLDPNVMLRDANATFDAIVAAQRIEDRATRDETLESIEKKIIGVQEASLAGMYLGTMTGNRRRVSLQVGHFLQKVSMPTILRSVSVVDRDEMRIRLTNIAIALGKYRQTYGHYPEALAELLPEFLSEIPQDLYGEKPLVYKLTEDKYRLYSLGPNQLDDDGNLSCDDDDIAVSKAHLFHSSN